MHQFLDANGDGSSPTCAGNTTGGDRLSAATTWLRDNKKLGLLGEFAGGVNSGCVDSVRELLAYIEMNADVWTGECISPPPAAQWFEIVWLMRFKSRRVVVRRRQAAPGLHVRHHSRRGHSVRDLCAYSQGLLAIGGFVKRPAEAGK